MKSAMKPALTLLLLSLTLITARAMAGDDIILSDADRIRHVSSGRIWTNVDVASQDVLVGPPAPKGFNPGEIIRCTFKDVTAKQFDDPNKGMTRKFRCIDKTSGKNLKIRYGQDNHEVYTQIIAHRLAWAIGLQAQKAYRVKVVCDNCPANPYEEDPRKPTPRATRNFDYATAQFSIGDHLGQTKDQGWDWTELDNVSPATGGAPKFEVDALRLFATFVYHIDSQEAQQEMICHEPDLLKSASGAKVGCRAPWLMVADLGGTFGGRYKGEYMSTNLPTWIRDHFWRDGTGKKCQPQLDDLENYFKKVKVTKAGADFFADRMRRLTQKQIRDLFTVSGINDFAGFMYPKSESADGKQRVNYTVDDWVNAFNTRLQQAVNHQCQN